MGDQSFRDVVTRALVSSEPTECTGLRQIASPAEASRHAEGTAASAPPRMRSRPVEESSLVVRGRIRHAEQIRRHHRRFVPVETSHGDYTPDIAENQILATAGGQLCRLPNGESHELRDGLVRLRDRMARGLEDFLSVALLAALADRGGRIGHAEITVHQCASDLDQPPY